jgi:tRNA U34 5-methylaminomethyl-2-thiouridine-forming methyltransferase MnmC
MQPQLLFTSDHSHTLYHPVLDETYHSRSGAIGESQYVYIASGLDFVAQKQDSIHLFEFGFGTGLNALLSWIYAEKQHKNVLYETIEKYPLDPSLSSQLNYGHELNEQEKMEKLGQIPWNVAFSVSPHFTIQKHHLDIFEFEFPAAAYDLVYFDAFAPSKQSEVWAKDLLEKIHSSLKPGGTLITYCSQGQFKRHLKEVGFELSQLPGPFKKKEITRALKAK